MTLKQMKEILIIKFFSLGDVLLATPFLRELKRTLPESRITFCVGEYSRSILKNNPNVDEIISCEDKFLVSKNIPEVLKFIFKLRNKKYDIIFVLHRAWEFRFLSFFLKGKKVGIWKIKDPVSEYIKYLKMLKLVNLNYSLDGPELFLSQDEEKYSEEFFNMRGTNQNEFKIALSPGGGKNPKTFYPSKRWPLNKYLELVRIILDFSSAYIILVGDKSERELAQALFPLSPSRIINATLEGDLRKTAAIIKNCNLFLGCDSGLTHIASSLGVPVIALFGPTDEKIWGPPGEKSIVIRKNISCSPCYKNDGNFYPCADNICMQQITAKEVWEKCQKLLKD